MRGAVDAPDLEVPLSEVVRSSDRTLFERAKALWQCGDWEALRALDHEVARQHPDRGRLSLLAAAGCQQLGDLEGTRRHVDQALAWGCDKRLVGQVLVAGVLNTLGRAAAAAGYDDRAREKFEAAVRTADPHCNDKLLGHCRAMRELVRLGLLPQALKHLDDGLRGPRGRRWEAEHSLAHRKVIDLEVDWLRERVVQLQRRIDQSGSATPIVGQVEAVGAEATSTSPKQHFGLHGLDRKLKAYIDSKGGYFVELGANDGVSQSNTLYFERERSWRGILIEPILHAFLKCKQNRAAENRFYCAACVPDDYDKPFVELTYANLMTAPTGLDSDIADARAHAQSGDIYLPAGETTVDVMAPARTLQSILEDASAPDLIDLLSLDVEGAELAVLKGVDHRRFRFRFMLIESRNVDRLTDYLGQQGYMLLDKLSQHDYLFVSR